MTIQFFSQSMALITKIRNRMKNRLLIMANKLMLIQRHFVETVFSSMKSLQTLIHHRHRCPSNAFAHLLAGLIHYQLRTDKLTIPTVHP